MVVLFPASPVFLRDVHDDVAEAEEEEVLVGQDLSEEVRDVVGGWNVGYGDALVQWRLWSSTSSRMKKWRRVMCLVLRWCSGL